MRGPTVFLVWVFAVSLVCQCQAEDLLSSVFRGLKDLEDIHDRHLEDLFEAGSANIGMSSRYSGTASEAEDLEPAAAAVGGRPKEEEPAEPSSVASTPPPPAASGSASQETVDVEKAEESPAPEVPGGDSSEEDDETSDEDGLPGLEMVPVRGLSSLFGFHTLFNMPKPWWTGPNVCVDRDEKEEKDPETESSPSFLAFGTAQFSNCVNSPGKYTCKTITKKNGVTKTSVVSYQCCHGFRRTRESQNCTKVETKPVLDLARELGAGKFADLVRSEHMEDKVNSKVTVFAPLDAALSGHQDRMDSLNSVDPVETNEVSGPGADNKSPRSLILGLVVEGVHTVEDLADKEVVETLDNSSLRVTILPGGGGALVNCQRLNVTDRLTDEGILHILEGPISQPSQNLAQLLSNPRFSKFKKLVEDAGLWELMSAQDKALTVFAVENEGVEKVESKHRLCMKGLLSHQILPQSLCSATASPGERLAALDLSRGWLPISTDSDDGSFIIGNGTKVTEKDILAKNGILHVASDFVIPSSSRSLDDVLERSGHSGWLKILQRSGLLEELVNFENLTMFVPTDEALSKADVESLSIDQLKELVKYHTGRAEAGGVVTSVQGSNLTITSQKTVLSGLLGGRLSVQCSPITRLGGRVCNGLLHEVGAVLKSPEQSIYQLIQSSEELTTLKKLLKDTDLESELKEGKLGSELTLLAPKDSAFAELSSEELDRLLSDKQAADSLLRGHILRERVCCGDVTGGSWPFLSSAPTLAASSGTSSPRVELNRRGSVATFGGVTAAQCDLILTDGLAHLIDKVRVSGGAGGAGSSLLHNRELILRRPNSEIILAGL